MIRSAAKNHERVAVVVDPADYARVLAELEAERRGVGAAALRAGVARRSRTPPPTTAPSPSYLGGWPRPTARAGGVPAQPCTGRAAPGAGAALRREPAPEGGVLRRGRRGRAVAGPAPRCCRARSCRTTTSWTWTRPCGCARSSPRPAAAIIKHTNPCGVRRRPTAACWPPTGGRARPIRCRRSAASWRSTARSTASWRASMAETFLECVIAPGFAPGGAGCAGGEEEPAPAGVRVRGARRERRAERRAAQRGRAASWCRPATCDHVGRRRRRGSSPSARRPRPSWRDLDFAWRVGQARQVERHRVRGERAHAGHRRRADVARRFGAHRGVQGARAAGRLGAGLGRVLPLPRRRRRGGQGRRHGHRRSRAARCATTRSSPPPTSTASPWSSPASATSGTEPGDDHGDGSLDPAGRRRAGASTRWPGSCWQSPLCEQLVVAPGNPGIAGAGPRSRRGVPGGVSADDSAGLVALAARRARRSGGVRARGAAGGRAGRRHARRGPARSSGRRARRPRSRARRPSPSA